MSVTPLFFRHLLCLLLTGCLFAAWPAAAVDQAQPVTSGDPKIPIEELKLVLKPLPKQQLLTEADAWRNLLQEKAAEIAAVEINIQRDNREIAAADLAEARQEEKLTLLEQVTALREERTALVDRLRTVLDELERKTAESDSDTLAAIKDYRLYSSAVSGISVNVQDTTSAWIAIKGWLLSAEGGQRWGMNIARFLLTLVIAAVIASLVSAAIRHALTRVRGTSVLLENFLVRGARWIILAVGLIMALSALEISIGPLLAVVGAAGFIIAFALQDSLSNFASGLMILFFKPFDQGDVIDAGGVSGKVHSMNLVSTTILTFDNKRMVVPNNKIWNDVITNITGVAERRVDLGFGIGYSDDVDLAHSILSEIVSEHPKVLAEPEPTIRVHALADSSVNFIVRPWAKTEDYWDVYWDITREVKKRFDAQGVGIPFPQRDVHLYIASDDDKALPLPGRTRGDRAGQGED